MERGAGILIAHLFVQSSSIFFSSIHLRAVLSPRKKVSSALFSTLWFLSIHPVAILFLYNPFFGGGGSTRLCVPLAKEIVIGNHNASKYFLGVPMI